MPQHTITSTVRKPRISPPRVAAALLIGWLVTIAVCGIADFALTSSRAAAAAAAVEEAPVLVPCSDGECAVAPDDGKVREVMIQWVRRPPVSANASCRA